MVLFLDESCDLHVAAAFGTEQRIDLVYRIVALTRGPWRGISLYTVLILSD
jgi:hypothetical protein